VELLEALLLLLKEPNPDGCRAHCEATWGGMMKKGKKESKVQRTGAHLCLLSLVKLWSASDIQDYISTMPKSDTGWVRPAGTKCVSTRTKPKSD
jgi:hypothetical protein